MEIDYKNLEKILANYSLILYQILTDESVKDKKLKNQCKNELEETTKILEILRSR